MREFELACVSDEVYLKYLKTLLISLRNIELFPPVNVSIINCKNEKVTEADLRKTYEFINIEFVYKDFDSRDHLRAYAANYRATLINKLLKKGIQNICYIDVDSLFINRINLMDLFGDEFDIKIYLRDSLEKRFQVAAGCILVKNNSSSQEFFQSWTEVITKTELEWFADQITFIETKNLLSSTNIKPLNKEYIDWDFDSTSKIWAGKGKRKKDNLKFVSRRAYLKLWNIFDSML